jgi:hypothetical protein
MGALVNPTLRCPTARRQEGYRARSAFEADDWADGSWKSSRSSAVESVDGRDQIDSDEVVHTSINHSTPPAENPSFQTVFLNLDRDRASGGSGDGLLYIEEPLRIAQLSNTRQRPQN